MAAALNGGAVSALVIFFIVCGSISVMGLVVLTCWYQRQDEKVYVDDLVQRGDAVDVERGGASTATGAGQGGDGAAAGATRRGSEGRGSAVLQSVEELLFHRELVDEQKLSDWRQQLQLEAAGATTVNKGSRPPSAAQRALDATLPPLHHHPMPALAPDELRLQHELHRHPHRFPPADDATASRVDVDRQPAPASSTTPSRQPSPRHVASPHSHVPHGRHPQPSTATAAAAEAARHSSHGTAAADKAKPPLSHQRRHSLDSAVLLLRTTPLAAIATSSSPSASLGPTAAAPAATTAAPAAAVAATMDPLLLEYRDQLRHDQQQKRLEALRHDPALVAYQRLATATATAAPPPTSTAADAAEQRRRRAQRRRSF